MTEYQERAVAFGDDGRLSGVITQPVGGGAGQSGVWCVMPNSGVVPRCGVSRLHVHLARALAGIGVSSLRFDLSGLGDSGRSSSSQDPVELAQGDLAEATGFVSQNVDSLAVCWVGLCSAAYDAIRFAQHSSSVVGIVSIDLFSDYRNTKHVVIHYAKRIGRPGSWMRSARHPLQTLGAIVNRLSTRGAMPTDESWLGVRPPLTRSELHDLITNLIERRVDQLFVFSGGLSENYNYAEQFHDVFPEEARSEYVSDVFLGEAGHIFDSWGDQQRLCRTIVDWMHARLILER